MNYFDLSVLFLAVDTGLFVGVVAAVAVVFAVVGGLVGWIIYKKYTEKKVGEANEQAKKIVETAYADADRIRNQGKEDSKRSLKEALLEAKEQDLKLRNEFERDTREKRA